MQLFVFVLETIFSGLILAAIGGLTWFARFHPHGFRQLYIALSVLLIAALCGLACFAFGVSWTYEKLLPLVEAGKLSDAVTFIGYWHGWLWTLFAAFTATQGYLALLRYYFLRYFEVSNDQKHQNKGE